MEYNHPRLIHNFFMATKGGDYQVDEVNTILNYLSYQSNPANTQLPKYKIGIMFICVNPPYWQYIGDAIQGARTMFMPGHDVEVMLWNDFHKYEHMEPYTYNATVFEADGTVWPYPTLMRYHLMLQQEEYLKKFDYIFYCDIDMRFLNIVGDEILGDGVTAAQHPMYALRREFYPPYEPNPASASYIPRPGKLLQDPSTRDGIRFMPYYYAGGFQGGKTEPFIKAMKGVKKLIDADLQKGYTPIWNDESAWNKYLFDNSPAVVLSPSYIYPDSLIKEYYEPKVWGCRYPPKLMTLTKKFTLSTQGGDAIQKMIS